MQQRMRVYAFDYGNRLRSIAGAESYRYDAWGRRARSSSGAGLVYSLYDQGGQLLFQRDERAGKRRQYVYLGGSLVAEHARPLVGSTVTVTYQHTDALGSPVVTTNASKVVLQRSEYEPYGKLLNRPMEDGPAYTGHVSDAATWLIYMQQRYYDPRVARFWSVDPVTVDSAGGNFNRYWYANNNPYRFTDPDGRESESNNSSGNESDGVRRRREKQGRDRIRNSDPLMKGLTGGDKIRLWFDKASSDPAIGPGGKDLAKFFVGDFVNSASNAVDGDFTGAAKDVAIGILFRKVAPLAGVAPEKLAVDMRKAMSRLSGRQAARDFHDVTHIADRTASELANDFIDVARAHGLSENKIPAWIRKMADE